MPLRSQDQLTGTFGDDPTAEMSYDSQNHLPQDFNWGNENMMPPNLGSINHLPYRCQSIPDHSTNLGPDILNLPYHGQWALDTGALPTSHESTRVPRNGPDHRRLAFRSEPYPSSEAPKDHQPITALGQGTFSGPSRPFPNIAIPSNTFTPDGLTDMVVDEPEQVWTDRAQALISTNPSPPGPCTMQMDLPDPQSGRFY